MQVDFIKYTNSGKIIAMGSCPEFMLEAQASPSDTYIMLVTDAIREVIPNIDRYYIKDGDIVVRPITPIVQDGKVFSNIPTDVPVTLIIENSRYEITEDTVDLDINFSGKYTIKFEHFPYLDAEFTVIV